MSDARDVHVSVIVPCLNERATIGALIDALAGQTYPRSQMEVVISDGGSTDGTLDEIDRLRGLHPDLRLRVVDNPARVIPAALNRAIEAADGELIVRLDAHCVPVAHYVEHTVGLLESGAADVVGGALRMLPAGEGWVATSIAEALAHRLGAGVSGHRRGRETAFVDTIAFGAFRRELAARVGGFDERMHTNEDYEFNLRVRLAGGRILRDPAMSSEYVARSDLRALARQYWRYGTWKARMLRRYPRSVRARQVVPPLLVGTVAVLLGAAPASRVARRLLAAELAAYGAGLVGAGVQVSVQRRRPSLAPGTAIALAVLHVCWGTAFLLELCRRRA